ncbi:MAG: TRAP transporter large permease subunit [Burkholderiales bacterium]|nr:TRAP transporter large permease subunit [Burkholderiales bacterium]
MLLTIALVAFVAYLLIGMPVLFALAGSSILALAFASDLPLMLVAQRMVAQIDSFTLLAVPLFVLAGTIMEQGGISERLVRFASCLVGHFRGGLAMACVLSSMIISGVSGASAADASAIGSILIPAMIARGYSAPFAASIQASAATMGPMIPPSNLAIIYAVIANVSIGKLFVGGIVPGLMICVSLIIAAHFYAIKLGHPVEPRATLKQTFTAMREASWALVAPVIILGGIVSGVFTATESGAIAIVYALIVSMFIYRELSVRALIQAFLSSALTTSMVMLVIAAAGVFSWILANENVPDMARRFLLGVSDNRYVILLLILVLMLAIGCVMEIVAAGIIMIPVLYPIANHFGFDPVYFAVLIMMTMAIGAVTPPVGVTLYVTLGIGQTSLSSVNRYIWPMVAILVTILFICALFPPLITFLPDLVFGADPASGPRR